MNNFKHKTFHALGDWLDESPFWQRLIRRVLLNNTVVPAKIYPVAEEGGIWWTELSGIEAPAAPGAVGAPPVELWEAYGKTPKEYLESGRHDLVRMLEILAGAGFSVDRAERILDFGCSAGRMIRWLLPFAAGREIWGVDIAAKPVQWAMEHFSPPLFFATNSTLPPLPFESGSFDLIYCGSVFTHIAELSEFWLLELRRLLKPGGYLYVTVHDKNTIKLLFEMHPQIGLTRALREADRESGFLALNFGKLVIARSPKGTQVFYDLEYLRRHWGRLLEIVAVREAAYGYQTALVLRKRAAAQTGS